jgi:hypothetical protein
VRCAQLPAFSKLPALVALYGGSADFDAVVESAVRITNNNDNAVALARSVARMLDFAIRNEPVGAWPWRALTNGHFPADLVYRTAQADAAGILAAGKVNALSEKFIGEGTAAAAATISAAAEQFGKCE